jgi:hypothetical protein
MRSGHKFFVTFLVHQLVGTLGVMILAGMLVAIAFDFLKPLVHSIASRGVYGVLAGSPYFPVQVIVALLLGWLLSDLSGQESMLWIWVLPYAWLAYWFARLPAVLGMTLQERFFYFFGWGCRPENHCIDQMGDTLPFYTAVAYSVGALLARELPMRSPVARRKVAGFVLTIGILILADEAAGVMFHLKGLLALLPQGWEWIAVPALALDTGVGTLLIFFAVRMRRMQPVSADLGPDTQ